MDLSVILILFRLVHHGLHGSLGVLCLILVMPTLFTLSATKKRPNLPNSDVWPIQGTFAGTTDRWILARHDFKDLNDTLELFMDITYAAACQRC